MKQIFIFIILSIALIGCETFENPQIMSKINSPFKWVSVYAHVDNPSIKYSYSSQASEIQASSFAKGKCLSKNKNNPKGCLRYSSASYYRDGKVNRYVNWDKAVERYNLKFNNKKINELESLIKDFENGKISRSEFNRKKKELIEN